MKKFLPLLLFLFMTLSACSSQPAYAKEEGRVEVKYYFNSVLLSSFETDEDIPVKPMSYTTTRNLVRKKGLDLTEGTLYRWQLDPESGEPAPSSFTSSEDVSLYLSAVKTNVTCQITYRYDYLDINDYHEQAVSYPYGHEYKEPTSLSGLGIEPVLYKTPEYDLVDSNRQNMPDYLEQDYVVYVKLSSPAVLSLDGKPVSFPYGLALTEPSPKENYAFKGYYLNENRTLPYTGVAVNGLVLFTLWERVSYTVTTVTEEGETTYTVPIDEPTLSGDALPETHVWKDEDGNAVSSQPAIEKDTVFYGETKKETAFQESKTGSRLTKDEIIAVIFVSVVFFIIGVFALIKYLVKSKRLDKKQIAATFEKHKNKWFSFLDKAYRRKSMHKPFKENCNIFRFDEPYAKRNSFKKQSIHIGPLPKYKKAKFILPTPFWEGHDDFIRCYDYAWQVAFKNLKNPTIASRFKSQFIDTAFNGFSFMWDSSFMVMFGKYGVRAFNFQKTLDNFYACQHSDGFISRELCEKREGEQFNCYDPSSTGPNILPWAEWEYYKNTGDVERLKKIFDPLMAYHIWLRKNRTWEDGSYWTTGLGSGMDNQPRTPDGYQTGLEHGHASWADACFQMIISANVLIDIAKVIGREDETLSLKKERDRLTKFANEKLWNEEDAFYYDLWRDEDGNPVQNKVKTIGAYWALLAGVVPQEKLDRFVAHLDNEKEFKRPNRVPSLSADHPLYDAESGKYWLGGVWAPTNYMVMRGLQAYGYFDLANEIAKCSLSNVVDVFNRTGTLWENYAPEKASQGNPAKPKFVGWSGLFPITTLFEGIFGLEADALHNRLTWRISCAEKHGVMRYPLSAGTADLLCIFEDGAPVVTVSAPFHAEVDVYYQGQFLYTAKSKK